MPVAAPCEVMSIWPRPGRVQDGRVAVVAVPIHPEDAVGRGVGAEIQHAGPIRVGAERYAAAGRCKLHVEVAVSADGVRRGHCRRARSCRRAAEPLTYCIVEANESIIVLRGALHIGAADDDLLHPGPFRHDQSGHSDFLDPVRAG